jgi:CBS domain-containing protein
MIINKKILFGVFKKMSTNKKQFYVRDLVIDDEYDIVNSSATVEEAAKKMKKLGVPDLVVQEKDSGKVLGVIADFDIIQNIVAESKNPREEKVTSAMYVIEPVSLNDQVTTAFERMQNLAVNVIPVVERDKLVGVVSIQDAWSYVPDETFDDVGIIPVENTKLVEFWFASVCAIFALLLTVIFPLSGIYGFFYGELGDLLSLFGRAEIRGGLIHFYLFEAHGEDFIAPYLTLMDLNGPIWIIIVINSVFLILIGILFLFTIIYTGYSDTRNILAGKKIRYFIPAIFIVSLTLEWIFFGIAFTTLSPIPTVFIDGLGLSMSIFSIALILLAMLRDYLFRDKDSVENNKEVA